MAKDLAIILNNGSINSAVVTALAAQKYRPVMLYIESNAQPGSRPKAAYDQQVAHFKPYREHTLSMPYLTLLSKPPSRQGLQINLIDARKTGPVAPQLIELLPLLAGAAHVAAHYQAAAVYFGLRVGSHSDDLAQATEYVQLWSEMLQLPCRLSEVEIVTPLLELEPSQVIDLGFQVSIPFDKAWSCLEETAAEPCWACGGCRSREAAFQQAARPDPLRTVKRVGAG